MFIRVYPFWQSHPQKDYVDFGYFISQRGVGVYRFRRGQLKSLSKCGSQSRTKGS